MKKLTILFFIVVILSVISMVGCSGNQQSNPVNPSPESILDFAERDAQQKPELRGKKAHLPRVDFFLEGLPREIIPGGQVVLYRWRVTNDTADYILIERFTTTIRIYAQSDSADLGGFSLVRNGEDITRRTFVGKITPLNSELAEHVLSLAVKGTNDVKPQHINYVVMEFSSVEVGGNPSLGGVEEIPPFTTVTYTLKAECGTGFSSRDMIMTYLKTDPWVKAKNCFNYLGDACSVPGQVATTLQTRDGRMMDFRDTCFIYRYATERDKLYVMYDDLGGKPYPRQSNQWRNGYGTCSWEEGNFPLKLTLP